MIQCEKCGTLVNVHVVHFGRALPIALCLRHARALDDWILGMPWGPELRSMANYAAATPSSASAQGACERAALAHLSDIEAWLGGASC